MHGLTSLTRSSKQAFLSNAGLCVCSFGSAAIGATLMLLRPALGEPWQAAIAAMILLGGLDAAVFWSLRRCQQAARHQAIQEVTRMLEDRINNDLAVILMNVSLSSRNPDADMRTLRATQERVERISQYVRTLSEESLEAWKARYDAAGHLGN